LIGTLLLGSEYREKHPLKPYRKDKRIIDVLRDKTLEIFTPEEFNMSPDTEGDSSHSNQDKK
jgi:hypothetical protein